jgi:Flp pilus assembly protein TadG
MNPTPADRGAASVEVAVLAPAFIALIVLAAVVGRVAVAHETIEVAAHDAARAASIERSAADAQAAAGEAVRERLELDGLRCTALPALDFAGRVGGDPTTLAQAFDADLGADAAVVVEVSCTVSMADVAIEGLDVTNRTVSATYVSPLDRYRARS